MSNFYLFVLFTALNIVKYVLDMFSAHLTPRDPLVMYVVLDIRVAFLPISMSLSVYSELASHLLSAVITSWDLFPDQSLFSVVHEPVISDCSRGISFILPRVMRGPHREPHH